MDIYENVKKVLGDKLNVDEALITPESNLMADLGASSLDRVDIEMELEEIFKVEISNDESQLIINPGDVAAVIERKLKLKNADNEE